MAKKKKALTGTIPSRVGNRTEKALKRLSKLITQLEADGLSASEAKKRAMEICETIRAEIGVPVEGKGKPAQSPPHHCTHDMSTRMTFRNGRRRRQFRIQVTKQPSFREPRR